MPSSSESNYQLRKIQLMHYFGSQQEQIFSGSIHILLLRRKKVVLQSCCWPCSGNKGPILPHGCWWQTFYPYIWLPANFLCFKKCFQLWKALSFDNRQLQGMVSIPKTTPTPVSWSSYDVTLFRQIILSVSVNGKIVRDGVEFGKISFELLGSSTGRWLQARGGLEGRKRFFVVEFCKILLP